MISVALVYDNDVFKKELISFLNGLEEINLLFDVPNEIELIKALRNRNVLPEIILIDSKLQLKDKLKAEDILRTEFPKSTLIVLSLFTKTNPISNLVSAGLKEYLSKNITLDILKDAVEKASKTK